MKSSRILPVVLCVVLAVLFVVMALSYRTEAYPFYVEVTLDQGRTETVQCWESETGDWYVFLPGYTKTENTTLRMTTSGDVYLDDVLLSDGISCSGIEPGRKYALRYRVFGREQTETVSFLQGNGLPVMHIETESGSMDYIHGKKGNEESGSLRLYTQQGILSYQGAVKSLRGRGNSTWQYEKKPYSLRLTEAADLLQMGSAEKWVLLANAADASHFRNKMVYDLARELGLAYSPKCEWVELYLNGRYAGIYLLSERNEVHPQRVDIDGEGSFLISAEIESRLLEENYPYFATVGGQTMRLHHAANAADAENAWNCVENAILAEDGIDPVTGKPWTELIDLDSWVKKYLLEEIFGNTDACYISQFYYRETASGKIFAGPVWDFDNSIGNAWQTTNPYAILGSRPQVKPETGISLFYALYQKDLFYGKMTQLYQQELLPRITELLETDFSVYTEVLQKSAVCDRIRWPENPRDLDGETAYIREYLQQRTAFLSDLWINGSEYYTVRADSKADGVNYAYYAVKPGAPLPELYMFTHPDDPPFIGWFYEDTGEPVDMTRPIYEDVQIFGKWTVQPGAAKYTAIIPLGLIAVMGLVLLAADTVKTAGSGKKKEHT